MTDVSRARRTLCVIARDEEAMLPDCLASAAGLFDEMVVVDTGSTDGTVDVARSFGARVVHESWRGDFSHARNAALDAVGDAAGFVLFLDADERLESDAGSTLDRIIEAEVAGDEGAGVRATVHAPLILNVDASGASLGADYMPRLWRTRADLRFTGRIHEQVGVGVPGLITAFEPTLRIRHLGYDPQRAQERGKAARNAELLARELVDRPNDPVLRFYLAKEAYARGDDTEAATGFLSIIEAAPKLNFAVSAHVFAAECLRSTGRVQEALDLVLRGAQTHPGYSDLWYVGGLAAQDLGRPIQAEALFREALKPSHGFALFAFHDPDIQSFRAEVALGQALRAQELTADAVAVWLGVHERVPRGLERLRLNLSLVEAYLALGQQDVAWARLEPLLDLSPTESTAAFLAFLELYLRVLGLEAAYQFFADAVAVHQSLLGELLVVSAGIELAVARSVSDDAPLFDLLRIAVRLGTTDAGHFERLAGLLEARGQTSAAEAARRTARRAAVH